MLRLMEMVDVGGCVGKIERITKKRVHVSGTYHYADTGFAEPWYFIYARKMFEENGKYYNGMWYVEHIVPVSWSR